MENRYMAGLVALAVILASCGTGVSVDPDAEAGREAASDETSKTTTSLTRSGPLPDGPSALENMNDASFPAPLIDPEEIISGGPPPDGIPSIDDPQFVTVGEADDWLGTNEPVIYLEVEGEVHVYPVQILIWHEIVNDTIGGIPVAVTYCPLCNSAVSYRREVRGETTTFGTSGRLYASALVMYDRATESLWTHFDGRAVVGVLTGEKLEPISSPLLGWSDVKDAFPDAMVLDRDATGRNAPYGENPYAGYDDPQSQPFLFRGTVDDRAAAKQRVVGVAVGSVARAWSLDTIARGAATVTHEQVGETPVVILWKAGQSSALESDLIVSGRDVGSVGVFSPIVKGERLTFRAEDGVFIDDETGSEWDITGTAIEGELEGTFLEEIHHLDTFWFAWSTYQPGTDLVD